MTLHKNWVTPFILALALMGCGGSDDASSPTPTMSGGEGVPMETALSGGNASSGGEAMVSPTAGGTPSMAGAVSIGGRPSNGGITGGMPMGGQAVPMGGAMGPIEMPLIPPGADLTCENTTWDSQVSWVILTHCSVCHSADLENGMRGSTNRQAPEGINFDGEADALQWRARIIDVATGENPSMPKAYALDATQQAILLKWLQCNPL